MRARLVVLLVLAVLIVAPPAARSQGHEQAIAETKAEVPALSAMHEVIYPLWHEAWPNKDVKMMTELLPQVQQHVAAVEMAELPGILRDKQAAWAQQLEALRATCTAYEKAAAAGDTQALLDAVEALHARFEMMVRVVRPVMKELDAYHQVLYTVYHKVMPEKRLADLPAAAAQLSSACAALTAAPIPKRFAAKEAELKAAFAALCDATAKLQATGADPVTAPAAVEVVHTRYQDVEKVFEK
jgi:phosphopantetheinyl transferase (holo-ACP synthase)